MLRKFIETGEKHCGVRIETRRPEYSAIIFILHPNLKRNFSCLYMNRYLLLGFKSNRGRKRNIFTQYLAVIIQHPHF